MDVSRLQSTVDAAWEARQGLSGAAKLKARKAVDAALAGLDDGILRVAEKSDGAWRVHQWLKKAVLLSFILNDMAPIPGGPGGAKWWDKVPSKFKGWSPAQFRRARFRAVPGAVVRRSAFIAPGAVLMPCFVNVGAHVGPGTMIDTWSTVGSCAQIGANCHISGGVGIGGVLEPLQASPVIVEDNCFIGARSEVAEGVIVEEGAVLAMGCFIGASTKIVDRASGAVLIGRVPAYSVVVPGSLPGSGGGPSLACCVIVKRVDARTRSKTSINELLRD
ncbi:MAG TPA: 2,3,4,5-tetrahydropyridine-2,6-dicarboxylate N-succinyltransferase [Stellaceae bacterium]|jgi:2,3,4,5-tetrahydropyridine-2-carboxylate N-succinyltransferase|nr:2,3,4,5-tetrahydropyridine-2,6-dicarboxylate N-succinyltransferase [Stellaceae bacterium]